MQAFLDGSDTFASPVRPEHQPEPPWRTKHQPEPPWRTQSSSSSTHHGGDDVSTTPHGYDDVVVTTHHGGDDVATTAHAGDDVVTTPHGGTDGGDDAAMDFLDPDNSFWGPAIAQADASSSWDVVVGGRVLEARRYGKNSGRLRHGASGGKNKAYYHAFYAAKGKGKAAMAEFKRTYGKPPSSGGEAFTRRKPPAGEG